MKLFLKKVFRFSRVFVVPILLFPIIDVFKVFGFQDYYANQMISTNREMITTSTYNFRRKKEEYNSFIFGSSRSQAYKCSDWVNFLNKGAKPFHFDASGENLRGLTQKIKYIDEQGDTLLNALVILDWSLLSSTKKRKGHLFVSMPCMGDNSYLEYYRAFFLANMNPKFLLAVTDYWIFREYRDYMGYLIRKSDYDHKVDNISCDLWYGFDEEINVDSTNYYTAKIDQGVFYKRTKDTTETITIFKASQLDLLQEIKTIFDRHNTNYKIVLSPLYDQKKLDKESLNILNEIFGISNVYDFSGVNNYTNNIANYYETSHYRPKVARSILGRIYNEKPTNISADGF